MIFRAIRRAITLVLVLHYRVLAFWWMRLEGRPTLENRALWAQRSSRQILGSLGIHRTVIGTPPTHGLVVANHLSYLDILILSAAAPCAFVSKMEIGSWPFFGMTARLAGTIFLNRTSRQSAEKVAEIMGRRFKHTVPVLLFPEGTSTDGAEVLRFHSRLIDPATATATPITAAALSYQIEGGIPERELCWYGDAGFLPHLWRALKTRGFSTRVEFCPTAIYSDRRVAADTTRAQIVAIRERLASAK
jgi:1-acyl-sn-glycerol-3-phosphate acyltransferase